MKVNIETQTLCDRRENIRGIPYYTLELMRAMSQMDDVTLSLSFFDYNKERNNIQYIREYCEDFIDKYEIHECNTLNYKDVVKGGEEDNSSSYDSIPYEKYIDCDADIYHFPSHVDLPRNAPYGKTVVTVHDILAFFDVETQRARPDLCKRVINNTKFLKEREDILIIADSNSTKTDLIEKAKIENKRIIVIPLSYNNKYYFYQEDKRVLEKYKIKDKYILYLGALDPRKGIPELLKAYEMINNDIQLVLSGGKSQGLDILEISRNKNNNDSIITTGYVSDYEKRVLMSMAEIFVFPSHYEGFGFPVLEAMACGTPVITTNVSSLPEVGGNAVVYVEPSNVEQLKNQIELILFDEEKKEMMKTKGLERCKSFSWEKTAKMTERVYNSVIERRMAI